LLRRERAKRLRETIQKLPLEYRLVLVLRDMEELSDDDVAEVMGLKPGTVRVRLHRARLFVRKGLEKPGVLQRMPKRLLKAPPPSSAKGDGRCKALFAQLSNYLDAELDSSLCEELEKHMDGCKPCKAFLASLERTIEQCRTVPKEPLDAQTSASLRRALLAEYQRAVANSNARPATPPPD
jgi:RNA polymerase sigma-70 factor (ECF subfamily)